MSKGSKGLFNLSKDIKGLVASYLVQEDASVAKNEIMHEYTDYFVRNGYLDVLKYFQICENNPERNRYLCRLAASNGHLNVLKHLYDIDPVNKMDLSVGMHAARGGHLDVLKYLHENECPRDQNAYIEAAFKGNLDVLKYLHQNK